MSFSLNIFCTAAGALRKCFRDKARYEKKKVVPVREGLFDEEKR